MACHFKLAIFFDGMNKKPVSIGLLGGGNRLRLVTKLLQEIAGDAVRVTTVYDPEAASVRAVQDELGSDICAVSSEAEAIDRCDWLFIGSFNSLHARQAVAALDAGKDVFCEKPLATNLEDCLAVREALERSGRTFFFGLVLRFAPLYRKVFDLVRSGEIGDLISFEFNETLSFNHGGYIFGNWRRNRAQAGTHLLEKCCHDLDLANWIVGSLPQMAASFGGRGFFIPKYEHNVARIGSDLRGQSAYSGWPDLNRVNPFSGEGDISDNQVAILKYANGVHACFHTNCNSALPERRFHLCGTEGTLRAEAYQEVIEFSRIGHDAKREVIDSSTVAGQGGHAGGDRVMAKALAETILEGAPPLATVEDGLRACIAAFGIDEAADKNRVVDLRYLWEQGGVSLEEIVPVTDLQVARICSDRGQSAISR